MQNYQAKNEEGSIEFPLNNLALIIETSDQEFRGYFNQHFYTHQSKLIDNVISWKYEHVQPL